MRLPLLPALLAAGALALVGCQPPPPSSPSPDAGTDAGTGPAPDAGTSQAPTLTSTTPAPGATGVSADTALRLEFSEPMRSGAGSVTVRAKDAPVALAPPSWDAARRVLTLQPTSPLPMDAEVSVSVQADFTDEEGQPLSAPISFRFTTAYTGPRTTVASTRPEEGARGVYPVELFYDGTASRPGVYLRKVLTLTFSGPMNPALAGVVLRDRTDSGAAPRSLQGQWSSDHRTLSVTVPAPEEGGPPLEPESTYALELTSLEDAAGHRLDGAPVLGDGRLDFTTGARDGDLEHACTHTLVNTPEEYTAAATPYAFPPATDTGHARYRLTLPGGEGVYEGYSEFISAPDVAESITLYFNRPVPLTVRDDSVGVDVPVETRATAPACAGITTQARLHAAAGDRIHQLHYGPTDVPTFEFIFERHAK